MQDSVHSAAKGGSIPVAADGQVVPQPEATWAKYRNDFEAMSDAAIDHETRRAQDLIVESEGWIEAVSAWIEAGRPRTKRNYD